MDDVYFYWVDEGVGGDAPWGIYTLKKTILLLTIPAFVAVDFQDTKAQNPKQFGRKRF